MVQNFRSFLIWSCVLSPIHPGGPMTLSRLVRVVQSVGMFVGCFLLLAAIATLQSGLAVGGLVAMSPVLAPFVAVEFLGITPFRRRPLSVNDLPGAK